MLKRRFFIFLLTYFLVVRTSEATVEWMEPDKLTKINDTTAGSGNLTYDSSSEYNSWIIYVNEERGLGIEISINQLSVEPSNEEFLLLASGESADENSVMVQILTGSFDTPLYYRLPNTRSFYVKISAPSGTFNLTYNRFGEIFTIDPPPTSNPRPPSTDDTTYQVILKGRPPTDFLNVTFQVPFSSTVKEIARKYCADKNITFEEKPVQETVNLVLIMPCSPDWPESEICTAVTHSIHVSGKAVGLKKDALEDYELTKKHLEDMWANYGTEELADIQLGIYELPSTGDTILWWLLLIGICLLVAVISLIVFWKFEQVFTKSKIESQPLEDMDGVEIRQKNRHRLSEYQNLPVFMTDPDVVLKYSKGSQRDKAPAPKPPPKPLALSNIYNTETSPSQQSPLSPVTPAGNFSAGLYFNYNNTSFVEDDEDGIEFSI